MPRAARKESSTSLYHVINRGSGKQIIFENDLDRRFFMSRLDSLLVEHEGSLLAWCLMDNHFHLLLDISFSDLAHLMHGLQTNHAGYFNRVHGHSGSLFGTRYKSEAVETDEYLMTLVRYIHENPRKAGAAKGLHYRWSSFDEYTGRPVHIDPSLVLSVFGSKNQFLLFHNASHDDDQCMDVEEHTIAFMSDEQALRIAEDVFGQDAVLNMKGLDRAARDEALVTLREMGLGVRQIQRLTGISLKVISRAGKAAA
jgi:REP element-mobilizing transposase RayT